MSTSLQLFNTKVTIGNYNNDFLILKPEITSDTAKIGKAVFQKNFDFVEEVVSTEVEICIKLNATFDSSKINELKNIEQEKNSQASLFYLPVYFGEQEDWEAIEISTGLSIAEIISKLEKTEFSIAMFGFLPGFLYMNGLDPMLHVPRKAIPSKYVKANSLAIGGKYLGLYSLDSPGGWHVVGRTPVSVLELTKLPPVALNPGDKIKIESIDKKEYEKLLQKKTE